MPDCDIRLDFGMSLVRRQVLHDLVFTIPTIVSLIVAIQHLSRHLSGLPVKTAGLFRSTLLLWGCDDERQDKVPTDLPFEEDEPFGLLP